MDRDSMGSLRPPLESSPAEKIGRVFRRLLAEYGAPWGLDEGLLAQRRTEWEGALGAYSEQALQTAVTDWIKTQDKWPKIANVIHLIADRMPRAGLPAHRSEPKERPTPSSAERVRRMAEIRERNRSSETPFSDTMADPEYQAILDEYTRETGRQPA